MAVPFVDLGAQYRTIQAEIDEAIRAVIAGNAFVLGPAVERFETDFAQYLGVDHVVGTSNGTTALQLSLLALGVGQGDEVILPAHTFIATAEAVSHVGARPVLVDVQEDSGNLDPERLADAVTSRTKAIIPVHLYGQPADLEPILEFGRRAGNSHRRGRLPGARRSLRRLQSRAASAPFPAFRSIRGRILAPTARRARSRPRIRNSRPESGGCATTDSRSAITTPRWATTRAWRESRERCWA